MTDLETFREMLERARVAHEVEDTFNPTHHLVDPDTGIPHAERVTEVTVRSPGGGYCVFTFGRGGKLLDVVSFSD